MALRIDGNPMEEVLESMEEKKPVSGKGADMNSEKKALTKDEKIAALKEKAKLAQEKEKQFKEKQKQFQARIEKLEGRDKEQERKKDTRRKIIVGGTVINLVKSNEALRAELKVAVPEVWKEVLSKLAEKDKDLFKDF